MLMAPCPVAQSEDSFLSVLSTLYGWAWMVLYTTHIQLTHNSTAQNRTEHTAASHSELRSSFARAQCSSAREQRLSVVHWIVMEINASPHPPLLISSGAKHRLSFSLAHIVRSRSGFSTRFPPPQNDEEDFHVYLFMVQCCHCLPPLPNLPWGPFSGMRIELSRSKQAFRAAAYNHDGDDDASERNKKRKTRSCTSLNTQCTHSHAHTQNAIHNNSWWFWGELGLSSNNKYNF